MSHQNRPIYLDCAATTPIDPRVRDVVLHYMHEEFGNAGSRTHVYGQEAAKVVKKARALIAEVVHARPEEVIFTSGATEANNLAILGLAEYGRQNGKMHIVSTQIEHKAVLEPLEHLREQGFEVELAPVSMSGRIDPEQIQRRLRDDTLLVSVMHVNNETGVIQPIDKIAYILEKHEIFFHVDAAQGFGKEIELLRDKKIDLISASAHKLYGPKGIGCLIIRSEHRVARRITPLQFGGGQERELRAGTLAVPLIGGFGKAAEIALSELSDWKKSWTNIERDISSMLVGIGASLHGDPQHRLGNTINFSLGDIDSEAVVLALKALASFSTGSACTSTSITPSHVIAAMYNNLQIANTACRFSWSHLTPSIPIRELRNELQKLFEEPATIRT